MKKKLILILFGIYLFDYELSGQTQFYQTECFSIESDGFIIIKIWNYKKKGNYKPTQARKDAIHAILYSGISGGNGCITQNPILNNNEERDKFSSVEKSFFAKEGKWAVFTRSSAVETTLPTNPKTKNWKVYQISISKNELRKYLQEKSIIKSLNTGF